MGIHKTNKTTTSFKSRWKLSGWNECCYCNFKGWEFGKSCSSKMGKLSNTSDSRNMWVTILQHLHHQLIIHHKKHINMNRDICDVYIYIYPSPASHMYTYIYICKISLTLKIHYISPGPRVFWDTPTPGPYHCHLHLAQGTTQGSSPALALGRWFLESCEGARYSETWGWQDQQDVMPLGPGKVQVSLHTSHQKWVPKSLIWKSNEKKNYFISQKET